MTRLACENPRLRMISNLHRAPVEPTHRHGWPARRACWCGIVIRIGREYVAAAAGDTCAWKDGDLGAEPGSGPAVALEDHGVTTPVPGRQIAEDCVSAAGVSAGETTRQREHTGNGQARTCEGSLHGGVGDV